MNYISKILLLLPLYFVIYFGNEQQIIDNPIANNMTSNNMDFNIDYKLQFIKQFNDIIESTTDHALILSTLKQGTLTSHKTKRFLFAISIADYLSNIIEFIIPFTYLYISMYSRGKLYEIIPGIFFLANIIMLPKKIFSYVLSYSDTNKLVNINFIKQYLLKDIFVNWIIDYNFADILNMIKAFVFFNDRDINIFNMVSNYDTYKSTYKKLDKIIDIKYISDVFMLLLRSILNTVWICNMRINSEYNLYFDGINNPINFVLHPDHTVGYGNIITKRNIILSMILKGDKWVIAGQRELLCKTPKIIGNFVYIGNFIYIGTLLISIKKTRYIS